MAIKLKRSLGGKTFVAATIVADLFGCHSCWLHNDLHNLHTQQLSGYPDFMIFNLY